MGANTIQAKYDELENIAKRFGHWAERNAEMSSWLRQHVEKLQHDDWIGKGSAAFFKEMGNEVLPAVDRLTHALQQSQSTVSEIIIIIRQAEEEAARPFSGGTFGLSQTSSMTDIVQQVIQDVSREFAGGSASPSMTGIVQQVIRDVSREFAGGSVGSSLADTIQQAVGDGGQQTAGAAPVLYQAHAPGNGTPPASPQKSQTPSRDARQV
ncbi:MAG: WXG100 family type VII secretion target [Anaerolineae bacterium]